MPSLALLSFLCASAVYANVVVTGTRVIYSAADREVSIRIDNPGKTPSLVQVWADKGNASSTPDTADAPFLLMPPIFRIDPSRSQTVRMTFTGADLPKDRESLFWFNVLDVPPLPEKPADGQAQNYLQIAFRSRLKLFYRPEGLPMPQNQAAAGLIWSVLSHDGSKSVQLQAKNPSPYYITLNPVSLLQTDGQRYASDGAMLAPFSSGIFTIKGLHHLPVGKFGISYQTIDDFGATSDHTVTLNH